jgi:hypothetical protein
VSDTTGQHCAVNQPEGVFFLAGTYGGEARRSCSIDTGVRIVVPAVNLLAPSPADCATFMAEARGTVTFDGAPVPLQSMPAEPITFETREGRARGVACGLWADIDALAAGTHRLQVEGTSDDFWTEVDYVLTVS